MALDLKNITTVAELEEVIKIYQTLLSDDSIITVVDSLKAGLKYSLLGRYITAVAYYHTQHKVSGNKDWTGAFDKFLALNSGIIPGELGFYIPNYCFLSLRNAKGPFDKLKGFLDQAQSAAHVMEEPQKSQFIGFCEYNWSRYLLQLSLQAYIKAAHARISYYQQVKAANAEETLIKSAATQVWKIYQDWMGLYGFEPISKCPVKQELFLEVSLIADTKFSATK
jgi:hypothetical protein